MFVGLCLCQGSLLMYTWSVLTPNTGMFLGLVVLMGQVIRTLFDV